MVVAALGLDGLDDGCDNGVVEVGDDALDLLQAAVLLGLVLSDVLLQGILQLREGSDRPVKGGDIKLMDRLAVGSGQTSKQTSVEALGEGEDRVVGSTRRLVDHGRVNLLLGGLLAIALLRSAPDKGRLVRRLVGVGAGGRGEDLVEALGGGAQDARLEEVDVVEGGEVAQGGTVDDGVDHLGG